MDYLIVYYIVSYFLLCLYIYRHDGKLTLADCFGGLFFAPIAILALILNALILSAIKGGSDLNYKLENIVLFKRK